MRLRHLVWLLLFWPSLATAAPLRVQTGEHANFTRVVVAIPQDADWQLGRTAEGYALRLPVDDGYDLAGFFDLIPKDRIIAVSQDIRQGELRLRVDCLCHARAQVYLSDYLVIDIRDGPASRISPFELAFPVELRPNEMRAGFVRVSKPFRPDAARLLPVITPRVREGPVEDVREEQKTKASTPPDAASQTIAADRTDETIEQIARSLGESLGRALTDGILEEDLDVDTTALTSRIGPEPAGQRLPGLDARTSIDPLAISSAAPRPQTQTGQACLAESDFDISDWGNDSPPHVQLQQARARLVDLADQVDSDALLSLARLYIYVGFGREAVQSLALEGAQSRERIILRAIAQLIDAEPVSGDLFAGQVSCPTRVALWALLAQPAAPTDAQVDRRAIVNAFRELPPYVSDVIAPRLSEALLAIGAQDEAIQVLGGASPAESGGVSLALAGAALSDALGERADAIETVTEVVRSNPRATPEAMVRFFEAGMTNKVAFSDEDFVLAETLRFENAGTAAADALAEAQFDALLSVDRFTDARALINNRPEEDRNAAQAQLLLEATERLSDGAFLDFVWNADFEGADAGAQNTAAERLLDLGFPEKALAFLAVPPQPADRAQQAALRDRASDAAATVRQLVPSANQAIGANQTASNDPAEGDRPLAEDPTLRSSRTLVEDAAQTRETIRALLESVPAPAAF